MGLRAKLVLALAAILLPASAGIVALQNYWSRRVTAEAMAEALQERVDRGALQRCERAPASWSRRHGRRRRHRRPPGDSPRRHLGELAVYDAQLRPARPDQPPLDPRMAAELRRRGHAWRADGRRLHVAVQVADGGPCAVMVLSRPLAPTPLWPALAIGALVVLAAGVAAAPLAVRIRRLTGAIERAQDGAPIAVDDSPDEIGELSRVFAAEREKLRAQMEALRRRDETLTAFVAGTTHDVMIPLTVLQGYLVKLRDRCGGAERELLGLALEEADYLGALMRNLGVAARLEAGDRPLERSELDLGALVERVVARHRPVADEKRVCLDFAVPEGSVSVVGDLTLLEQLVSNLVHNAVRYNEPGGHVAVVLEADAETFRLEVLDDGPGVRPDELSRLGERRFRTQAARDRQTGGSGLGLSIAREVAERHRFALSFALVRPRGLRATLSGRRG